MAHGLNLIVALIVGAFVVALAPQGLWQQPSASASEQSVRVGDDVAQAADEDEGDRRGHPARAGRLAPLDEREWMEVATFMEEHSPHRMEMFRGLDEQHEERTRLMHLMARRHRWVQQASRDEDLYAARLRQIQIEDDVVDIVNRLRRTPWFREHREVRAQLQDELHEKLDELFDLSVAERERRIAWLEQRLSEERAQLAEDIVNRDDMIEQQVEAVLSPDDPYARERFRGYVDRRDERRGRPPGRRGGGPPGGPGGRDGGRE